MMRPVILSSPEKLAFLLMIFWAGGSDTTSSPGCRVAGGCGLPFGWRTPGGRPGSAGLAPGAATATVGGAFWGITVVPGGAGKGCDCTDPGGGAPGRVGAGRTRPFGGS